MNDSQILYEFPITSRVRSFLRFEYLIDHLESLINANSNPLETIRALHQILELIQHNDIKSELLRHIRWQEQELQKFTDSSPVDQDKLLQIVEEKQETIKNLDELNLSLSDYTNNYFLSSAKLRLNVPGGTCNFDLPEMHAWLHFSDDVRHESFKDWFRPFSKLNIALKSTLSLTRMSAEFSKEVAEDGYYMSDSRSNKNSSCMIRIKANADSKIYPEISAGTHHFRVYFYKIENLATRPCKTNQDIHFELSNCTL